MALIDGHGTWRWGAAVCAALVLAGLAGRASAESQPSTITAAQLRDEHVLAAVDAIVNALYERRSDEHFWDPPQWTYNPYGDENQVGGYTALCALALLYAGQSYQDPRLRGAIDHLQAFGMSGTYAVSLRAHIWAALPRRYHSSLEQDQQWLIDGFSERARGWGYAKQPNASRQDNSLRQYGALGLWEAAKRGVACDERYWRMLEEAYIDCQLADGGWNYRADASPPRGSMTAAGLTVLFITQDFLHAEQAVRLPRRGASRQQRAIDQALQWMAANFSPTRNPGRDADFYYYLYGVERVGLASGYRYFGEHDWFREGAAELIRRLCAWDDETRTMTVHRNVAGDENGGVVQNHHLAFALMFLSRGRVPIAVNKLRVDGWTWNNRPRDVANFTTLLSDSMETPLNWQVVDMGRGPASWLDAPMLYLASDAPVPWIGEVDAHPARRVAQHRAQRAAAARGEQPIDALAGEPINEQLAALKMYLDRGGLLFTVNEGSRHQFDDSIEKAGQLMYPQYEWRDLPADHWVYRLAPIPGRRVPLRGLSNGVRELIIRCPVDLSRTLQSRAATDASQEQTAMNVYLYASEFNAPKPRLQPQAETVVRADDVGSIVIARGLYDGNWNPEPEALPQWAEGMDLSVELTTAALATLHESDPLPTITIISGVEPHVFTAAELQAIEQYVRGGGTIMFETVGGMGTFATGAEQALAELFASEPRSVHRHAIVTGEGVDGAVNASRVEYRPFALQTFGGRETTPRLRAIFIDNEPRIIFSRDDLSHALLDQPCWGVSGYTTESAAALLRNITLYAGGRAPSAEPEAD